MSKMSKRQRGDARGPYSVCRRCWLLLAGRYRSGADLHLLVDGPDNGRPGSTYFVVEARLQRLTEGPNQRRTQGVVVLLLHSVSHMALSQFAQHRGDPLLFGTRFINKWLPCGQLGPSGFQRPAGQTRMSHQATAKRAKNRFAPRWFLVASAVSGSQMCW